MILPVIDRHPVKRVNSLTEVTDDNDSEEAGADPHYSQQY
jgi:hypothetical protein